MDGSHALEWSKSTFAILVLLPRASMTEYNYSIVMHYIGNVVVLPCPHLRYVCIGTLTRGKDTVACGYTHNAVAYSYPYLLLA